MRKTLSSFFSLADNVTKLPKKAQLLFVIGTLFTISCSSEIELTEDVMTIEKTTSIKTVSSKDAVNLLKNQTSTTKSMFINVESTSSLNFVYQEKITNSDQFLTIIPNNENKNSKYVFLNINGKIETSIITTFPENTNTDPEFTGKIIIQRLDGSFVNGFRLKNGIIISRLEKKTTSKLTSTNTDAVPNPLSEVIIPPRPKEYFTIVYIYYPYGDRAHRGDLPESLMWDPTGGGGGSDEQDNILFLDKVIIDSTFQNNPCLINIYNKLGGGATFQEYLSKFDGKFSIADLKLSVGIYAKHPEATAATFPPVNKLIEIRFNPTKLGTPQLNIARVFIHEMIHAEIYRELLSVAGTPNIPWSADFINSVKDDFKELSDYYTRFKYNVPLGQQPSDAQHELMADHYRDVIIQAMKEFDPTQSNETYSALSWIGLMGSGKIDDVTGLPPLPTVAWKNISQAQRIQLLNIFYNFRDTNTPCQ